MNKTTYYQNWSLRTERGVQHENLESKYLRKNCKIPGSSYRVGFRIASSGKTLLYLHTYVLKKVDRCPGIKKSQVLFCLSTIKAELLFWNQLCKFIINFNG